MRVCLYVLCGHLLGKGWPLGSRLWCLLWVCHITLVSWVRCGTWLYRFLIFAPFTNLEILEERRKKLSCRKVDLCCVQETRYRGYHCRIVKGIDSRYKLFWSGNSGGGRPKIWPKNGFFCFVPFSALDRLLGQLGIYARWLSSIAYLQKQLRIFIFFTSRFFLLWLHIFLLHEAIGNVLAYLFTPIVCLSKVSN